MNCFFHHGEVSVASCVDCGKGLCQTCAARYEIAICDNCNIKRHKADKNLALKKYIPSLLLFILGFIALFALLNTEPISMRITGGFFGGWFLGGTIWGLYLTRSWFRPRAVYVNTSSGLDHHDLFNSARGIAWIFVSVIVGSFAMVIGLTKLIIVFVKAKKVTDSINAYN